MQPVADINDAYVQATLKLGDEIEQYIAADVYDKVSPYLDGAVESTTGKLSLYPAICQCMPWI
jgi:hypothetical protein